MTFVQTDFYSKSFLQLDAEFKRIAKEIIKLHEEYLAGEYSPTEYDIEFQKYWKKCVSFNKTSLL